MHKKHAALLFLMSLSSQIQAENVLPQDGPGITMMVLRGDRAALSKIGEGDSLAKLPAKAGLLRVDSSFKSSDEIIKECIDNKKILSQEGKGAFYLCKSLQAGNLLALGDIDGWARTMIDVRDLYRKNIQPRLKPGDDAEAITWPNFEAFIGRKQSGTLRSLTNAPISLPINSSAGVPVIAAFIQGGDDGATRNIQSEFVIDTGSTRSILNEKFARSLGLKITERFYKDVLGASREVKFNLAAPVDLRLGGLVLHDVSFSTSNDVALNIIGMDLLRQLGAVELSSDKLVVFGNTSKVSCGHKFYLTSLLWGSPMAPRIPATIRGREEMVLLDTGSSTSLEASGIDLKGFPREELKSKRLVDLFGERSILYAESNVPVNIQAKSLNVTAAITDQKGMVFPVSWRLGFGLISKYKLYLDAQRGQSCFME